MAFVPIAVAAALVWKLVSAVKFVLARDYVKLVTQLVTWVAGVAVAFLLAASDFASSVDVGDQALGDLNAASVVLFGVALGSVAAAAYDSLSKNPEPKMLSGQGEA